MRENLTYGLMRGQRVKPLAYSTYFYESTNSGAFFFYENRNVSNNITDEREIKILFELFEKRNEQRKSTIVCSQRDPTNWKAMILNDEVSANSIMKRATKHYTIKINTR